MSVFRHLKVLVSVYPCSQCGGHSYSDKAFCKCMDGKGHLLVLSLCELVCVSSSFKPFVLLLW